MSSWSLNRPRVVAATGLAVFSALLGLALRSPRAPVGEALVRASYDTLHMLAPAPLLTNPPVAVVYLDLPSYQRQGLDPARPWPRELHARLLRRLSEAGARAVVFDIVFASAGPSPESDRELAAALQASRRAVLAAEYSDKGSHATADNLPWARAHTLSPPFEPLAAAAAAWGIAEQVIDDDFVVRRYLAGFTSGPATLTWAAAKWLDLPVTRGPTAMKEANTRWLRYYGAALTLPHTSYSQALDPAGVPDGFFRDKIVLVGSRPVVRAFSERGDEFRSPFHSWRNKELFLPGVEVHATQMLNLLRGEALRRSSPAMECLAVLCTAILLGGGLIRLRPVPAAAGALALSLAILFAARSEFSRGTWFPWLILSAIQVPAALSGAVLFHSIEWYRTRRRLEAARRAAEEKIREQAALIDKAHDAILVQDLEGKLLYANASAEKLHGWKLAELRRETITGELFAPDARAVRAAREATLAAGEWNGELQLATRRGATVTVNSRWTLISGESGRPGNLLLINSDITERKALEAQFLRMQRLNTIGSLAGGMAHDLNNALAPILLGIQLLWRKSPDEETRRLLNLMQSSTHRGAGMIRQVLLFARGRGGELAPLEPGPLLRELERLVRDTFPGNITVEAFVPDDLWQVRGNATQLHQVLLNLCVNARDAMPNGGRLSLAADNTTLSDDEAAALPQGKPGAYVSLLVSDTGSGISPAVRARLFEPFFTTKPEGRGTGIGLATVLRIVESHHGFLRVESEPGEGSTFEVFLPALREAPAPLLAPAALNLPRGSGEWILLAGGECSVRELLGEGLVSFGYRVLHAGNSPEALQLYQRHAAEVRLLITEHSLPSLQDRNLVEAIRQLNPGLPVIITTGEAQPDPSPGSKLVRQLQTPFTLEDILTVIQQLLPPRA
jgi:PAS domain S-box-containing protein